MNDKFEIVGVIDFDGVMAAPIEVVAQYPVLTGLDRGPPGHVATVQAAIDRVKRVAPQLKEYKDMVVAAEAERGIDEGIADLMVSESDAASAFQGHLRYMGHQLFVSDKWIKAYVKLLQEKIKPGETQAR